MSTCVICVILLCVCVVLCVDVCLCVCVVLRQTEEDAEEGGGGGGGERCQPKNKNPTRQCGEQRIQLELDVLQGLGVQEGNSQLA